MSEPYCHDHFVKLDNGDIIEPTSYFVHLAKSQNPLFNRLLNFLNAKITPLDSNLRTFYLSGQMQFNSFCDLLIDGGQSFISSLSLIYIIEPTGYVCCASKACREYMTSTGRTPFWSHRFDKLDYNHATFYAHMNEYHAPTMESVSLSKSILKRMSNNIPSPVIKDYPMVDDSSPGSSLVVPNEAVLPKSPFSVSFD